MRNERPFGAHLALIVLFALAGAGVSRVQAAGQRCDLVSQTQCLDVSKLDGATIQVPLSTTRISTKGLNLCGVAGSSPEPTDIVYVMDQSISMVPTAILPGAEDTSGWFECNRNVKDPVIKYVDTVLFHGSKVSVVKPGTSYADLRKACSVAGDPYSVRLTTVQNAVRFQAEKSPNSYASIVSFHGEMDAAQMSMTQLSTPAKLNSLLGAVPLMSNSGTNYEEPLTWARIQLYGGKSGETVIAPSVDASKAIIMISDGYPNTGTWENALRASNKVEWDGKTWTTSSNIIPPIYTIYLGVDTSAGAALSTLAERSNAAYYRIPPNMPDSLTRVIQEILGKVINSVTPDSLFVANSTNGQASHSTVVTPASGSYQMALDSLVALEPGSNQIKVTVKQGANLITANWTVLVADSTGPRPQGALDPYLIAQCGPASALSLKPDKSGLAWADTADRNIVIGLTTKPEGNASLPISLYTRKSTDAEPVRIAVPAGSAPETSKAFGGSIPWQNLSSTGSVVGDAVLRSGPGWDSARAFFQMPRDRRDTASAMIGLHHASVPVLAMTPTLEGPTGRIQVAVLDSEVTTTTLTVTIKHRLGDSLKVKLTRGADGLFYGSFSFAGGIAVVAKDTVLQMGTVLAQLDSIAGTYLSQKATTLVTLPSARLRFVDASGTPLDSIALGLAVGGKTRVTVQAFIGSEPCLTCNNWLAMAPTDPGISIYSTTATAKRIDSLRLSAGQAVVEVRGLSPVLAGSIVFRADSIGSSISARPVRVDPLLPDSVVYFDDDGDGSLDRADVFLKMPWRDGNRLLLPWDDSTKLLDVAAADMSLSPDALKASFVFKSSTPLATAAKGTLLAKWRHSEIWSWSDVRVVDRIAPVPLRAILRRGTIFDTLRVSASERIWPALTPNGKLVTNVFPNGALGAISPRQARLDAATGELILVFPSDSIDLQVNPGDSVRFTRSGSLRDSMGNAPGEFARQVIVEGLDHAPQSAYIFDTDADGRADRVVVHFRKALAVTDRIGFRWPDTLGVLQSRELPVSAAQFDSLDRVLAFDVEPFAFGATACPNEGCQNLGWLASTRFPDVGTVPFAVQDRIDAIILRAHYAFSASGRTLDTLSLTFSEPVTNAASGPWVSWGRPSRDSFGIATIPVESPRLVGGVQATILLDSSFTASLGDSVRISSRPTGALSDMAGNLPGKFAFWTRLQFGAPQLILEASIPTPVVIDRGGEIPVGQKPITLLVRKDPYDSSWTTVQGEAPMQPVGSYSGMILNLNRIPEGGGIYIYDLLGTAVVQFELTGLIEAANAGQIERTRRGDYQIFLAWDGRDMNGQKVSTGIYIARAFGWVTVDNQRTMINVLKKMGIRRELPINIRRYNKD
ncbi:MAG: vWA domain-containing protein [Fibrobacterota bacterium]